MNSKKLITLLVLIGSTTLVGNFLYEYEKTQETKAGENSGGKTPLLSFFFRWDWDKEIQKPEDKLKIDPIQNETQSSREKKRAYTTKDLDAKMRLELTPASSPKQNQMTRNEILSSLKELERQPSLYSPATLFQASKAYYTIIEEERAKFWFYAAYTRLKEDLENQNISQNKQTQILKKLIEPILLLTEESNYSNPLGSEFSLRDLPNINPQLLLQNPKALDEKDLETINLAQAWNEITPRKYDPKKELSENLP